MNDSNNTFRLSPTQAAGIVAMTFGASGMHSRAESAVFTQVERNSINTRFAAQFIATSMAKLEALGLVTCISSVWTTTDLGAIVASDIMGRYDDKASMPRTVKATGQLPAAPVAAPVVATTLLGSLTKSGRAVLNSGVAAALTATVDADYKTLIAADVLAAMSPRQHVWAARLAAKSA